MKKFKEFFGIIYHGGDRAFLLVFDIQFRKYFAKYPKQRVFKYGFHWLSMKEAENVFSDLLGPVGFSVQVGGAAT